MPYSGTLWYNPLIQLAHYYKPFFMVWNKTSAIYLFSALLIHQQYYHDHQSHFGVPGPIFSTINSSLLTMNVTYHYHMNCLPSFRECLLFCNFPLTVSTMYQLTWRGDEWSLRACRALWFFFASMSRNKKFALRACKQRKNLGSTSKRALI